MTTTSLSKCVLQKLHGEHLAKHCPNATEISAYLEELIEFMKSDEELVDITCDGYYKDLKSGRCFLGDIKLYVAYNKEHVSVKVLNDLTKTNFTYACSNSHGIIKLV